MASAWIVKAVDTYNKTATASPSVKSLKDLRGASFGTQANFLAASPGAVFFFSQLSVFLRQTFRFSAA
ncbi:hypothetical protein DS906_19255 [Ruegeria sp. A3M17]|nr:hypothetical protein DS906_19255 [Ruegeria sp. A3M17]